MSYSSKKLKVFWEITFWLLVLVFLALSITKIVLSEQGDENSLVLRIINSLQTVILAIQMPLMLLKLRSTVFYFIQRNRIRKELNGKGVSMKKHDKVIINEEILNAQKEEASKSEIKKLKHNTLIAYALKEMCGEQLRGTPYYQIKEIMVQDEDRKPRIQKIVTLLKASDVVITDNIKTLLKSMI